MLRQIQRFTATLAATLLPCFALAQAPPAAVHELGVKYMRDSEEYSALARQVYRLAGDAIAAAMAAERDWAVVLDVDETALDNSTYMLERAAYQLPFESASWSTWIERREAPVVPGITGFVALVRRGGGHVAWITNRQVAASEATRGNLRQTGLWADDDRLCTQKNPEHSKAQRRREVVAGRGECAWTGRCGSSRSSAIRSPIFPMPQKRYQGRELTKPSAAAVSCCPMRCTAAGRAV